MNAAPAIAAAPAAGDKRVSFAFAKRHGVLIGGITEGVAHCTVRGGASPLALAEVRRYLRLPLHIERVDEATFDKLLQQATRRAPTPWTPSAALRTPRT
jgi:general secretion pathway protein E